MEKPINIIAKRLPKKMVNGDVVLNHDRANDILNELRDEGYVLFGPEIRSVISNALNMLIGANNLTPDDRKKIAQSALSTVWGGFFPVEDK